MPHKERHSWVEEISKINKKINQSAGASGPRLSGGSSGASVGMPIHRAPGAPPSTAFGGGFNLTQPDDD